MRGVLLLVPLALLAASCGTDREAGRRHRAEREIWRADWEYQSLSLRPEAVSEERWTDLAGRYESIAERYAGTPDPGTPGTIRADVQTIAARALFAAARIHGALRDSNRVEILYEKMAGRFGHLPDVAAEVALVRGRIAEGRGDRLAAAELYESAADRVEPRAGVAGAAGVVLDLPLRAARMRAAEAGEGQREAAYRTARAYYRRHAAGPPGDAVQVDAQVRLAELAADLGEWDEATSALHRLEAQLRGLDEPPRHPCEARFAVYGVQNRAGLSLDLTRQTLIGLLEDYPDCPLAGQVLLALASNASRRGRVDEALQHLDRIAAEPRGDVEAGSQALLARARLLDRHGRWPEALESLRMLPIRFPLSTAALQAPLEIVLHHAREDDEEAARAALAQAERDYRDFLARYPPGPLALIAREHLAQTLALSGEHDEALDEMVRLGEELSGSSKGASLLLAAARMAYEDLADTARAAAILERVGDAYGQTSVGRWATGEATRMRGTMAP
ncbi:MAG: hypothetical protein FJY75_08415 [Candidatus Eisenbacteria bacterium]|uniref:Tetratricopeptide repeat protein n=1 Tax=Eiseniibacteriota bacterium TaxID=2212470 RepID=A0A938BMC0_UNCEI|nr:hypothetical protein [Candidatus Eisenbacteria bacterium]